MRSILFGIDLGLVVLAGGIAGGIFPSAWGVEIHVGVTGDDQQAGTEEHPFATPERARQAVRTLRQRSDLSAPPPQITVVLHGGKYFRSAPFRLTREDSGSREAPIIWRAPAPDLDGSGPPRFIGGRELEGSRFRPVPPESEIWTRLPDVARPHVLQLELREAGVTDYGALSSRGFHNRSRPSHAELIINDRVMPLARWPNEGFATTGTIADPKTFHYAEARPSRWQTASDPWAFGYWRHGWADEYIAIDKIDPESKTISLATAPHYAMREDREWYALNLVEEIDQPGEWYLDRQDGMLYLWPPTELDSAEILLTMEGSDGAAMLEIRDAAWILIQGITFEAGRSGAVSIRNSHHIVLDDCLLRNLGDYGAAITGEACGIVNSTAYGMGGRGISLYGGDRTSLTRGNLFAINNHIHHFARWSRTYNPGIQPSGVGSVVRNNRIHDCPHSAILAGGNEHTFERNEIFHACEESDDAGAFYSGRDWGARGMEIRHNFFHDIGSSLHQRLGVHAVYLDDCLSGDRVFGNVFYRVTGRAIMCGGGRDNLLENNVIVRCGSAFFTDRRGLAWIVDEPGSSWNLREKIRRYHYQEPPWSRVYPRLAAIMDHGYQQAKEPEGCLIRNNIGWKNEQWLEENCLGACDGFDFYTIDHNLEDTNPNFVDEAGMNFGLQPDSPAYKLPGFQRIPFDDIGLQENPLRGLAWLYFADHLPQKAR